MRLIIDIDLEQDQPAETWEQVLPLRGDQKRALFAAFGQVFGTCEQEPRHLFTRMILGLDVDAHVSWACGSSTCITDEEASRLLDVLDACERTLVAAR